MTLPSLLSLLTWPPGQAPWAAQEEAHARSANERLFALLMEQRTGKTPVVLGKLAYQYRRFLDEGGFGLSTPKTGVRSLLPRRFTSSRPGKSKGSTVLPRLSDLPKASASSFIYRPGHWAARGLDALLVVAMPSGIPKNWADEIALRFPAALNPLTLVWDSSRAETASFAAEFLALISHEGPAILLINGEAIPTALAKKVIGAFLRARRALVVGDETSLICSQPGNVRSKVMNAIRKLPGSISRMILDGTPGDETPFDLFQQFEFLKPGLLGTDKWSAFKRLYGVWETESIWKKNPKTGKPEELAVPKHSVDAAGRKIYQNLDKLAGHMAAVSFRVKRSDCFDVPPKLLRPYRFDLSATQRAVYDPLKEAFEAWLRDGSKVTKANVLARMVALDQIGSNYLPPVAIPMICPVCEGEGCEECGDVGAIMAKGAKKVIDGERNPRLDALKEVLSAEREPGIIWCRFDETVDAVLALAARLGRNPVRYDGKVTGEMKAKAKALFQGGHAGLFVAKESSAGRGLDLSAAGWMGYLEPDWSKRKRSQSEDRCEVAGRTRGTGIIDFLAYNTYDEEKLAAHQAKGDVADYFMSRIMRRAA